MTSLIGWLWHLDLLCSVRTGIIQHRTARARANTCEPADDHLMRDHNEGLILGVDFREATTQQAHGFGSIRMALKKRSQSIERSYGADIHELGGVVAPAPRARENLSRLEACIDECSTDRSGLRLALAAEIALCAAVIDLKVFGVPESRCNGMPDEQGRSSSRHGLLQGKDLCVEMW